MSETNRILDLIDRAFEGEAWHGPSLTEAIAGLPAAVAARRPPRAAHSIWGLVEHVASWNEIVALRLAGEAPDVPDDYNFPPVPKPTPAAWKAAQGRLERTHAAFRAAVEHFPAAKLGRRRPGTDQTWYVMIHGQIQHVLYHAGQIAVLRRELGKPLGG
jgi:uncharacterized damage-inducible protein DinB